MDQTFWRSRQGTSEQQTTVEGHRVTTTTAGLFIPKDAAISGTRGDTGAATMALWFTESSGRSVVPGLPLGFEDRRPRDGIGCVGHGQTLARPGELDPRARSHSPPQLRHAEA